LTALDTVATATAAVVIAATAINAPALVVAVGTILLTTGQFSDGGHGRTVGFSERSIVSYSVEKIEKK
jgi:hypothetical protein